MRSLIPCLLILLGPWSRTEAQDVWSILDAPGRWPIEKANRWYEEQPWLVGCNFIPSTAVNQLEMWQGDTFDEATIDREMGMAKGLGFNTLRVSLHDLPWRENSQSYLERIERFLDLAEKHDQRVIFVLFDSYGHPLPRPGKQPAPRLNVPYSGWVQSPGILAIKNPAAFPHLKEYVEGVVGRFAEDRRVIAWDVWNDPDRMEEGEPGRVVMEPKNKPDLVNKLLKDVFGWIRELNPSQPLTTPVWNRAHDLFRYDNTKRFQLSNSDVISFHHFADATDLERVIEALKSLGRPVLCTAFVSRTSGSNLSPQLDVMKSHRVAGYCSSLVRGKTQTIFPSGVKPSVEPNPEALWDQALLHPDGSPYLQEEKDYLQAVLQRVP